jgi:hypothetical protein
MAASIDSFGASRFPLTPSGAIKSAADYDPGLASIIGLLCAAIEANVGAAWRAMVSQLDETSKYTDANRVIGSVLTVIPNSQNLTQVSVKVPGAQTAWPLLAVYRSGVASYDWKTTDYRFRRQEWSVDYILGPLGPDTQRKMGHFVVQVLNSIVEAITLGFHPAYMGGAYQFYGQFSSIDVLTSEGPAVAHVTPTDDGAGYFGGSAILESVERMAYQSGATSDTFNAGAYTTTNDGYGTASPVAVVDVDFGNKTEPAA